MRGPALPLVLVALLATALPAAALTATRVTAGLHTPVFAASPPDDPRLFVLERRGTVRVLDPETGELAPGFFLDLRASVDEVGEGGLLGLAFDPDWAQNGYLYVYYTADGMQAGSPLTSRLSRFEADGDVPLQATSADEASERILFELAQPFGNHNGGTVAFGPDALLYLGLGDGGARGDPDDRAQDEDSLFGKLLRFDPTPPLPSERLEPVVVAKGLRNPFRFAFDGATGDLFIGDVGQEALEEVDLLPADVLAGLESGDAPVNFGWDVMEGSECFDSSVADPDPDDFELECGHPDLVLPIHEYAHAVDSPRCSVTGGVVYRGSAVPSLVGDYLFADFCSGEIWTLPRDGAEGTFGPAVDRTEELAPDAGSIDLPVAFARDAAREVYVVDMGTETSDGELFRLPEPSGRLLAAGALAALAALARLRGRGPEARRARPRGC